LAQDYPDKSIALVGPKEKFPHPNITQFEWSADHKAVRDIVAQSKWAVITICLSGEGFPTSTQVEYAVCGIPAVYNTEVKPDGVYLCDKTSVAYEDLDFDSWEERGRICREYALENFSSDKAAAILMETK
jgi:hypothetical protein